MSESNENVLKAAVRTEFGKGAARRTRRAGRIPAVLYGHGSDPVHLSLPDHDTFLALKGNANALLTLDFGDNHELALVKDVQRDAIRRTIDHLDLILVRRGEKVVVDVPVVIVGETAPGTIHTLDMQTISLQAEATNLPEHVEVNIEGLEEGSIVRVGELTLPEGSVLEVDPESVVINVTVPRASAEDLEADAEAEAAGEAAGAAGEAAAPAGADEQA
ncbi:50S ribosomal protein L25/general stress protein Ctc [Occultella aeris]|uniref:Large ribosomal subunit protein bL25 n=1 Tax=Occultella aeris TaxID=2761496 RepID=A0A7M4DKT1_9MICO|nr:50S ribosomal protein L25/general stress protein Ctc [Occultella aeris]VZO37800.1 50S ribosomal protein L25 [Occultella aeris]